MRRKGGHHVLFVTKWTATTVTGVGGNQANSVCEATFKRTDDMVFMWPQKVTPRELVKAKASRIAMAADRIGADAGKGTLTQAVPAPPRFDPTPEVLLAKASGLQHGVETLMAFSTFVARQWPWMMFALLVFYGVRIAWASGWIGTWRAEMASMGTAPLRGGAA